MVKVKFHTLLQKATGVDSHESSARNVASLLDEVRRRYGEETSRYLKGCIVLVNGKNIGYLAGTRTKLSDGDEVSLFPPVAGG